MALLLDTGAVYALADRKDKWHASVQELLSTTREEILIPVTVLPEAAYLLNAHLGQKAERAFVESCVNGQLKVRAVTAKDLERVGEILDQYHDADLGFVDASVMALAERLEITRIVTVDRRDFSLFRPTHCESFELLP